jgi:hypothetical protein
LDLDKTKKGKQKLKWWNGKIELGQRGTQHNEWMMRLCNVHGQPTLNS